MATATSKARAAGPGGLVWREDANTNCERSC